MRRYSLLLTLMLQYLISFANSTNDKILELNTNWIFRCADNDKFYQATVPGTIHSDLLKNKLIENPFVGTNENKVQWIENKEWEYKTIFNISSKDINKYSNIDLILKGIDTFADIYINNNLAVTTDNMFIEWQKEIKKYLRPGKNEIRIIFHSPLKSVENQFKKTGINYPADNDKSENHLSVYARKAPYHYGWDWGIRLVGCGIWRPIYIKMYNGFKIIDSYTETININNNNAEIKTTISIENKTKQNIDTDIALSISLKNNAVENQIFKETLKPGINIFEYKQSISSPQLWMPNGWGDANIYAIKATVASNKHKSIKEYNIGLRTIEFINNKDSIGQSFYFKVNGEPIFAKGANYIPSDIILTNVTKKDLENLFKDIKSSNMNMIRIWGGGIYEDDYFYELADKNGILIWQDFMFACSTYPGDSSFLENISREAEYNIKRIRNHPSLALWCGNNEIYEGIKYWGWNKRYTSKQYEKMKKDYDTIFKDLLPKQVKRFDPLRSYIHTSPDSANWGRPHTQTYGDIHYWGIWYGQEMFDAMDTLQLRFVSEYGFESFPEMKTLKTFASEKDMSIDSEVMKHRQKSSIGNDLISKYMENYYKMPENFDDFVYIGLILQGHGISHCIETNRRQRPVCMGSLYWQLNDSWPAISWSAIDYYKNKKALYYHSKKSFSPIILSITENNDSIYLYSISDKLSDVPDAEITVTTKDFAGNTLNQIKIKSNIKSNRSNLIFKLNKSTLLKNWKEEEVSLNLQLKDSKGKEIYTTTKYLVKPKELKLPKPTIVKEITRKGNVYEMKISTDKLAKDIFIEIPEHGINMSDNFFDLQGKEEKTIIIKGENITPETIKNIRIRTLRDTYKE